MSRADNTAHLLQAAADRRDAATRKAVAAIAELDRSGTAVTVAGVANTAGVSRSWLYEQPALLAEITQLRDNAPTAVPVPAAQRASGESLRQPLDAARTEIERLRTENTLLRDQIARALGKQRIRR